MTRCQHCKKLTHSIDLVVEYEIEDQDKVFELTSLEDWKPKYLYSNFEAIPPEEYGKLKCGDIWIHFRVKKRKTND